MLDEAYFTPLRLIVMLAFAVLYMENKQDCFVLVSILAELTDHLDDLEDDDDDDGDRHSYIDSGPNAQLTNAILTVLMTFFNADHNDCQMCCEWVCYAHRKNECTADECRRGKKQYEQYCLCGIDETLFVFYPWMQKYGLGLLARIEKCNEGDTSRIREAIHDIKSMVEDTDTTLHPSLQPTVIDDTEHGACIRLLRMLRGTMGDAARITIDNYEKHMIDTDLCIQREYRTEVDKTNIVTCFTLSTGFTWISMRAEYAIRYGCIPDIEHAVVVPNAIRTAASKFFKCNDLVFHLVTCACTSEQVLDLLLFRFPDSLRMTKTSVEMSSIG
jgi:hypothetical protein